MKNLQIQMNQVKIKKISIDNYDINTIINNTVIPIKYYNNNVLKITNTSINCTVKDCSRIGNYNINNTILCWIHCQKI
jgi:hypothetical protein